MEIGVREQLKSVGPELQFCRGRKTYLIGSHVGSIYSPGVRDSARKFSSSQPIAANPLFKGPTDDCRRLLPIGIRWIERGRNCHERVSRVSNGDVDWESQTDIAHCHANVVGDFVDRLSNDVALCVEFVVNFRMLINCVHNAVLRDEEVFIVSCSPPVFDQGQQVINRWSDTIPSVQCAGLHKAGRLLKQRGSLQSA